VLIYLHFLCIFKLLAADAATLEYAQYPRIRASTTTHCTHEPQTKMAFIPKLPSGA
jgi:hypothetical protein